MRLSASAWFVVIFFSMSFMHISMNRVRAASAQKGSEEPPSDGMRAAAAAVNSL